MSLGNKSLLWLINKTVKQKIPMAMMWQYICSKKAIEKGVVCVRIDLHLHSFNRTLWFYVKYGLILSFLIQFYYYYVISKTRWRFLELYNSESYFGLVERCITYCKCHGAKSMNTNIHGSLEFKDLTYQRLTVSNNWICSWKEFNQSCPFYMKATDCDK